LSNNNKNSNSKVKSQKTKTTSFGKTKKKFKCKVKKKINKCFKTAVAFFLVKKLRGGQSFFQGGYLIAISRFNNSNLQMECGKIILMGTH